MSNKIQSIEWREDHIKVVDQNFLPNREVYSMISDVGRVWEAIRKMRIRGAPAIGIAAAYGLYMAVRDLQEKKFKTFIVEVNRYADYLKSARPTARNLQWAIDRQMATIHANKDKEIGEIKEIVLRTAITIHDEDKRACKKIGEHGVGLIKNKYKILTHGNAGGFSAARYGTALSIVFHAHEKDIDMQVWVDETRPMLQGTRLTAWELKNAEIPMKLIPDSAAASLMRDGKVDIVLVGTHHVASNGDAANKIGTYPLAVLADLHDIPFYIATPLSTIDMEMDNGEEIPIEIRDSEELTDFRNIRIAPKKTETYNPAFDITPHEYITGFVTEKGIIEPPFDENFAKLFSE